jgi:hypothetical protein
LRKRQQHELAPPRPVFFLSLVAIVAAFLAIIYEIYEGIRKFRRRKPPIVEPICSTVNETAVDSFAQLHRIAHEARAEASPSPRNYLKTANR